MTARRAGRPCTNAAIGAASGDDVSPIPPYTLKTNAQRQPVDRIPFAAMLRLQQVERRSTHVGALRRHFDPCHQTIWAILAWKLNIQPPEKGSPTADAFLIRSYGAYKPFIINTMGFVRYNPATALSAPVPHSRSQIGRA